MRKYFGTDGIRGLVNSGNMTPEIALRLGVASGHYFKSLVGRHLVIIGKDTRLSGYMVENALVAGLTSAGMDAVLVGPVPTPAIPILTKSLRADAGIMISASHNPYYDNGIKIFAPNGYKLSDNVELEIERLMDSDINELYATPQKVGRAMRLDDVAVRYAEHIKNALPLEKNISGFKIALDTANGAGYKIAPKVFEELGAEIVQIGDNPNGKNINDGVGATAPNKLSKLVVAENANIGFALDGDADRLIVVDEKGNVIDGDQIIAIIANYLNNKQQLSGNVVTTVMSNMGLEEYLSNKNIGLTRTAVGDRYVVQEMQKSNSNLGGEQSGHIVASDFSTTGDGILAGIYVLCALIQSGKLASDFCKAFKPYPQVLENVRVNNFSVLKKDEVVEAIKQADIKLADTGRTLIRKSGTEPIIRVMAEARSKKLVKQVVDDIVAVIKKNI
ncbi:MAG: phosphoglucosamine mutase [Alphaproteobacteria bacterium]|nr:phosphoglucosamine mutase [Alphaproteobacteria bacterium]